MRVELIEEFIVLSETLNYRAASELLFVSQPTLTKHIRELEDVFGVRLFERDNQGARLTDGGRMLLPKAKAFVAIWHDMLRTVSPDSVHAVRIAVPLRYTSFSTLVARVRRDLSIGHPAITCHVDDLGLIHDPRQLIADGCDVVITHYATEWDCGPLRCWHLADAPLFAWIPVSSHLAAQDRVTMRQLSDMVYRPVVNLESPWARIVARLFAERGLSCTMGPICDDQYELGPLDFGLVFAGAPTSAFGFNAVALPIEDGISIGVSAVTSAREERPATRVLLDSLARNAPGCFG